MASSYSTAKEIESFMIRLGTRPMFVCDMDGNIMRGYTLAPGKTLPLGPNDNPANQAIPYGTSQEEIERLVKEGVLVPGLFAEKAMDARLPVELVEIVNDYIRSGNAYRLGFLTSRGAKDAVKLMKESGIDQPEKATLVADSGGALYFNGVRSDVRKMSPGEIAFLESVNSKENELNEIVRKAVSANGFDASKASKVFIEQKGTAVNIHYRTILNDYGQPEGSGLDSAIGGALKEFIGKLVEQGPNEEDGSKVFKTLGAPAAVEMKVAKVNKGHGLEAIALEAFKLDNPPTSIAFSGDDVCKGDGGPGTDYYAMIRAEELAGRFGIPFFNIHTHHPEGGKLDGTVPDPNKAPDKLSKEHPAPRIDLVVPRPGKLVELILTVLENTAGCCGNDEEESGHNCCCCGH